MLHRLILSSPMASGLRTVFRDFKCVSFIFLATATSLFLGSHIQVRGGAVAAGVGTAEVVPRAAGISTWTKLCAKPCNDVAAAAAP
jgi:hypothetical protein